MSEKRILIFSCADLEKYEAAILCYLAYTVSVSKEKVNS